MRREATEEFRMEECKIQHILVVSLCYTEKRPKGKDSGSREASQKTTVIIQARPAGGLDQGCGSAERNKLSDSVYPRGFAKEEEVGEIRKLK